MKLNLCYRRREHCLNWSRSEQWKGREAAFPASIKQNTMIIIWYQIHHSHYLVAFLGRPKVVLVAVGAPGFTTAGLQLFQWAVINRGVPDV